MSFFTAKKFQLVAIGDTTTDAFIRIKDAKLECELDRQGCKICIDFASKVPYESVTEIAGVGNSANAAVSTARLGLRTALISDVGQDEQGKNIIKTLSGEKVATNFIHEHKGLPTNYHYVLWYEDERTILVKHQDFPRTLPDFDAEWIYLSSLGGNSLAYHRDILKWLAAHPNAKLAFQPGTFQMKAGLAEMGGFYSRSEVVILNVEEAQLVTGELSRDIKILLSKMKALGARIVLITDGPKGAYVYDGTEMLFQPIYPDPKPPLERTGAGDAFASTFVAFLAQGLSLRDALLRAPINSMSVVQEIGAQKGLLSAAQIEHLLKNTPENYKQTVL